MRTILSFPRSGSPLLARGLLLVAFALILLPSIHRVAANVAVDPDRLEDPVLEARAQKLMRQIRCLVCQNQSIADSNADLAADLRRIVREQVAAGRTDGEIKAYLTARYGEWVLMRPPFERRTLVLWLGPPMVFLLVLFVLFWRWRNRSRSVTVDEPVADLDEAERAALKRLMTAEGMSGREAPGDRDGGGS
ncbi:MAG: cytochrome c-type biogenesis protein CcmH [Alphaproteobacteria bacterium]|nr:MAG: cytochrome c-type biogenesis protein CcmH [Alphaproteobacteria bacterium]